MSKTAAELDKDIEDQLLIDAWKKTKTPRHQVEYGSPLYWSLARDDKRKKELALAKRKAKPTTITDLNLFTLASVVVDYGGHVKFPNQIEPTQRAGMKRCVAGGYVKIVGKDLVLTPAGRAAVGDWIIDELDKEAKNPSTDDYYRARGITRVAKLEHAAATLGNESA